MSELIPINYNGEEPTVSARDLYNSLEISKRFSAWFETNSQGFVENEDFTSVLSGTVVNNGAHREIQDYSLSVDMAKHICLMSRTEKGKECRQYLIDLEKAWNTPEQVFARALKMADQTIAKLKDSVKSLSTEVNMKNQIIGELKPKADYYDEILNNPGLVTITQIAKDYGMSGKRMNEVLVMGLQEMNDLRLPVWVDDTESVNSDRIPELDTQMILLKVSDGELKVKSI